jgi:ribosomal protein S27E
MASKKANQPIIIEESKAGISPENQGKVFFLVRTKCRVCGCRERVYSKETETTYCSKCGKRMPKIRGIKR